MKILIIRLSAIGDIVMASPLPTALKRRYPNAEITWLCQPECQSLVSDHPGVDRVIIWPRGEWQRLWNERKYPQLSRAIRQLRKQLRSEKFDLALDLQGLFKSGYLTWLSGAKKRIGLGSSEGSQFLMHKVLPRDQGDSEMISSEYLYLAKQLGCPLESFSMELGVSKATTEDTDNLLSKLGIDRYLIICPFTTRPQKHWFQDYWQETAKSLARKYDLPVILLGGPADIAASEELCNGTKIINLAGKTSLQEAAELIRRSKGVIGVDTGLTHIGHAMKVPTLALFGSTRPYLKTGLTTSKVIYLDLHCAPCRRNPTCDGKFDCLRQITPATVAKEFSQLMAILS